MATSTSRKERIDFFHEVLRELLEDYERLVNENLALNSPRCAPSEAELAGSPRKDEGHGSASSSANGSIMEADLDLRLSEDASASGVNRNCSDGSIGRAICSHSKKHKLVADVQLYYVGDAANAQCGLRAFCAKIIGHPIFDKAVLTLIAANVVFMGITTDYAIKNLENPDLTEFKITELIFCLLYLSELLLKLCIFRFDFFTNEDFGWNWFDMALVIQSLYEQIVVFIEIPSAGNMSFLRTMRLLKMLKMMRVVRLMRSMLELRLIIASILGSVKSMFWSLVLLIVVLYLFAMVFVQSCANFLATGGGSDHVSKEEIEEILSAWGSLVEGMFVLFYASTGGLDWREPAETLFKVSWILHFMFCVYISFFVFVILNTITALFVEGTISSSMKDHQACIQSELEKKSEYVEKLRLLFDDMDEDGDGLVSIHEFSTNMNDARMLAFLASMEIEVSDTLNFFGMLSDDGKKAVDLDTFVTGCIRMKGQALSVDLQEMRHNIFTILDKLDEHSKRTAELQEKHKSRNADVQEIRRSVQQMLRVMGTSVLCEPPVGMPAIRASAVDGGTEALTSSRGVAELLSPYDAIGTRAMRCSAPRLQL